CRNTGLIRSLTVRNEDAHSSSVASTEPPVIHDLRTMMTQMAIRRTNHNCNANAMGYCHCRSCRSWSGGPVNAFSLWPPEVVRITTGAEHVATFQKTKFSQRKYC